MVIADRRTDRLGTTLFAMAAGLGLCLMLAAPTAAAERVMVVLDGSGSMWGQIEGEAKISIARRVLSEVLGSVGDDIELGLMAYGHRREGDCSDIELIVPPGPGNGPAIGAAAEAISPLGKTPLTESVRQAAEALSYADERATVILITDGIETCEADPCALADELAATGVDFRTHVVGFGLSPEEGRQVACLAERTGGLYLPADDAEGLQTVLSETVAAIAEAEQEPVEAMPEPAPEALPEASLDAPETIEIGLGFTVGWFGPGQERDVIQLWDPNAGPPEGGGLQVGGRRLVNGDYDARTVDLIAPVRPGIYELRYVWRNGRDVLATREIEVVEAAVSVDAPATVPIGGRFEVSWVGPGANLDSIEIVDPTGGVQGAEKRLRGVRLVNGDYEARTVAMNAPAEPGFYRLQYWSGDGRQVLASREIEVLEAPVSLMAPDQVSIGAVFETAWIGPGERRDSVLLVDPAGNGGQGKELINRRLVNGNYDNKTVAMNAPATPGTYELRYWNGDNRAVLATRPITVVEAEVSLDAPGSVPIAQRFEVSWVGPGAQRDSIELYDPDARAGQGQVVQSRRIVNGDYDARTVPLDAPAMPGAYVLRYWNADSRIVLAELPITVEAMEVALEGPARVGMANVATITWTGPGAQRDSIEIFDPAAKAGAGDVVNTIRIVNGDYDARTVQMPVPARPGDYQFRYWNGDSRAVLATRDVTVEPVPVSIDAPASVAADEFFEASWVGPGAYRDSIEVFDPDASAGRGQSLTSARIVNGDYDAKTVRIRAPREPGDYVIRYWNADYRTVLFETAITVR